MVRPLYSRLKSKEGQIRLLHFCPGNGNDSIQCWLSVTKLWNAGDFVCLSYAWGEICEPEHRKDVWVRDNKLSITPNLYYALRRLRERYSNKPLWIDALCINQLDEIEQNEQIKMMGEIYRNSSHLLIFLGDPLQPSYKVKGKAFWVTRAVQCDVTAAIDFFERLEIGLPFHKLPYFTKCVSPRCPSTRTTEPQKPWAVVFAALNALAQSDWFNRTWTILEVVLQGTATVIYGQHSFSWDLLVKAWLAWNIQLKTDRSHCIMQLPDAQFQVLRGFSRKVLDLMWAHIWLKEEVLMIQQLIKFQSKVVSNPRDRIYGLLGLQSSPRAVSVTPNYNDSVEKVFLNFAVALIRSQGWIVTLHLNLTHPKYELPSWVLDLIHSDPGSADYEVAQFRAALKYDSSRGLDEKPELDLDGPTIQVLGIQIGTIAKMSEHPCRFEESNGRQIAIIDSWLKFDELDERGNEAYIGGGTLRDAFMHTLFADQIHDDDTISPLKQSDIDEWHWYLEEMRLKLQQDQSETTYGINYAMTSHMYAAYGRRLFTSSEGHIGLCPERCWAGDMIFVISHCKMPIILRPVSLEPGNDKYTAVGASYVHGWMKGEAVEKRLPREQVIIV